MECYIPSPNTTVIEYPMTFLRAGIFKKMGCCEPHPMHTSVGPARSFHPVGDAGSIFGAGRIVATLSDRSSICGHRQWRWME